MPDRYIKGYEIRSVACVQDIRGPLTPLHAFIGPNDSGKSSILRAFRIAMQLATGGFDEDEQTGELLPFDPGSLAQGARVRLHFAGDNIGYAFDRITNNIIEDTHFSGAEHHSSSRSWNVSDLLDEDFPLWPASHVSWARQGSRFIHFAPAALRADSELIPEDGRVGLADEYGHGLAGIFDVFFNRGDDSVLRIMQSVRRLFPTIQSLRLRNRSRGTKALEIELTSGERVPAAQLSEGLLFYLAFAALQHLDPVALLLVEEPENGLHPSRIADVMRILREISKTTQVVLATHSPLVINEMQGDEVTLVTRDPKQGTQVRLLSSTPHFAERSKVYALGELWLSYANGLDEAPLLRDDRSDAP